MRFSPLVPVTSQTSPDSPWTAVIRRLKAQRLLPPIGAIRMARSKEKLQRAAIMVIRRDWGSTWFNRKSSDFAIYGATRHNFFHRNNLTSSNPVACLGMANPAG
jgi:hypothetical protein